MDGRTRKSLTAELPPDMLFLIGTHAGFQDTIVLSRTDKALQAELQDEDHWQRQFKIHFPQCFAKLDPSSLGWKKRFKATYLEEYKNLSKPVRKLLSLVKENNLVEIIKFFDLQKYQPRSIFDYFYNERQKAQHFSTLKLSDLNQTDSNGMSLWDWIRKTNNQALLDYFYTQIVKPYFVNHQSTIDSQKRDKECRTIFYYAITCNQALEEIMLLHVNGSNFGEHYIINFQHFQVLDAEHLLHYQLFTQLATEAGRLDVLQEVVRCSRTNFLLKQKTTRNETHLIVAAAHGHTDVVHFLLAHGAVAQINEATRSCEDPQYNGYTALHWAASHGHAGIVKSLCARGANPFARSIGFNSMPIHVATKNNHLNVIKTFLAIRPTLINVTDANGQTPLLLAAEHGYLEIVEYLLLPTHVPACHWQARTRSPHVSQHNDFTALHWAAINGHTAVVKILLPKFMGLLPPDMPLPTPPLHLAAEQGRTNVVQTFIQYDPAFLNQTDVKGTTALMLACKNGQLATVKFLLAQPGINLNAEMNLPNTPYHKHTALHWACENGHDDIVKELLKKGALARTETHVPAGVKFIKPININKTQRETKAWLGLAQYVDNRPYQREYKSIFCHFSFSLFGYRFNFSEKQKTPAAVALKNYVFFGGENRLKDHAPALTNGTLNTLRKNLNVKI